MKLSYDLHIHSCLSPCGDNEMTPANIAGMAAVLGLDVIALTDHNSCRNCGPLLKMAEVYGITALPGMELTTDEDVHVLCLFPDLYAAMDFDAYVYSRMFKISNKEHIFGPQILYNENDQIIDHEPNLLIANTSIDFEDVFDLTEERGGIMIPAHIEKSSNSLISNLGFVPPDSQFLCAELKDLSKLPELKTLNPYLYQCKIITNSDAHYLEHINEATNFLEVQSRKISDILRALKGFSKCVDK